MIKTSVTFRAAVTNYMSRSLPVHQGSCTSGKRLR